MQLSMSLPIVLQLGVMQDKQHGKATARTDMGKARANKRHCKVAHAQVEASPHVVHAACGLPSSHAYLGTPLLGCPTTPVLRLEVTSNERMTSCASWYEHAHPKCTFAQPTSAGPFQALASSVSVPAVHWSARRACSFIYPDCFFLSLCVDLVLVLVLVG